MGLSRNYKKAEEQFEKGYVSGCTTSLEGLVQVVHSGVNILTEDVAKSPGVFHDGCTSRVVEDTLNELLPFCVEGDIIIDHGNSNFKD